MRIRNYKKISELDALTSASLETYVAGVNNGETVKISLNILADGVRDTINTLDDQRLDSLENFTASFTASVSLPNGVVSGSSQLTSSYDLRYTLSGSIQNVTLPLDLISSSAQITAFGFISSSQMVDTGSFVTTSSFESFSSSVHNEILAATNEQDLSYLVTTSSFNEYTTSISTGSLVDRLNQIESVSGSWITESETGSFAITGSNVFKGQQIISGAFTVSISGNAFGVNENPTPNNIFWSYIPNDTNTTSIESGWVVNIETVGTYTVTDVEYDYPFVKITLSDALLQLPYRCNGYFSLPSSELKFGTDGVLKISGSLSVSGSITGSTNFNTIVNKPTLISGSSQLTSSYDERYVLSGSITQTTWDNIANKPAGIVSSSIQVLGGSGVVSGSYETTGRGILSGSISYNDLTNIPQNIASGSYETTGRGIISSSTQIVSELENATITNLTITNLHSVYQTSSVVYASGSNQFGDALTDSHIFSGSVIIVGSGSINGYNILTSNDTGSFETTGRGILSGSIELLLPSGVISGSSQITAFGFVSGSYETTGRGILSGSISYTNLTDIPQGIVSGAGQITPLLPSGVVSGSSQLTSSYDILYINATETSSMAVSSSLYALTASFAISTSFAETASYSVRTSQTNVYVKNVSGAQIDKGKVVRISGATGDNPLIVTASFLTEGQSANTLGITTENIANDGWGWVITEGILLGVDTIGMNAGQLLFLGQNGSFTTTPPTAPNHGVRLGEVLRQQQNNGSIYVRIDNGSELGEAHDVVDTSTISSYGDVLMKSGSVWVNNTTFSSSISTFSASFDNRINAIVTSGTPLGTVSGSSQLTSSYDTRYVLSGSVSAVPEGTISSSAQITSFGFISGSYETTGRGIISSSLQTTGWGYTTTSSFNTYTASQSTASLVTSITNINSFTSSTNTSITNLNLYTASASTLSGNNTFTGTNVFSGSTYFSGSVVFEETREVIVLDTNFGLGTRNFDYNSGSTFYLNNLTGSGTWNIQNFVSASQRVTPITFIVEQGATAYSASAYTLGGTAVSVKWQNGTIPVGLANKTDVFALSVFRSGSTFNVLGSYSTFG